MPDVKTAVYVYDPMSTGPEEPASPELEALELDELELEALELELDALELDALELELELDALELELELPALDALLELLAAVLDPAAPVLAALLLEATVDVLVAPAPPTPPAPPVLALVALAAPPLPVLLVAPPPVDPLVLLVLPWTGGPLDPAAHAATKAKVVASQNRRMERAAYHDPPQAYPPCGGT